MTILISDQAEEFRIEISGRFAGPATQEAEGAWQTALSENKPRRISVDITPMTGYSREGYMLLREIYTHGTHIVAGTPKSLLFLSQISSSGPMLASIFEEDSPRGKKRKRILAMRPRAAASGK